MSRAAFLLFGMALGISFGGFSLAVPESPIALRIQAVWRPEYRDVRRGEEALAAGSTQTAVYWFDRGADAAAPDRRAAVLHLIRTICVRHTRWQEAKRYAWKALLVAPTAAAVAAYGECVAGDGDPAGSLPWFEKAMQMEKAPGADRSAGAPRGIVEARAQGGTALALAQMGVELSRAQQCAEAGLRAVGGGAGETPLGAELDDILGWVFFRRAEIEKRPDLLAIANVYVETAMASLVGHPDPALSAEVCYHLSLICAAEGKTAAAAEAYANAMSFDSEVVHWCEAHVEQGRPAARRAHEENVIVHKSG